MQPNTHKAETSETVSYPERQKVLAMHLNCPAEDIEESQHDETQFEHESAEYMVLDDDEANERWEEALESYIDECIISGLPETAAMYFDRESWKRDARFDGRGHCLNYYDDSEEEIKAFGQYWYIYRTN